MHHLTTIYYWYHYISFIFLLSLSLNYQGFLSDTHDLFYTYKIKKNSRTLDAESFILHFAILNEKKKTTNKNRQDNHRTPIIVP